MASDRANAVSMVVLAGIYDCVFKMMSFNTDTLLDRTIDSENNGVSKDLGRIADFMSEWEGPIAEHLELTQADIAGIKLKYQDKLNLQTSAGDNHTMTIMYTV